MVYNSSLALREAFTSIYVVSVKNEWGIVIIAARLAQSVERKALNLVVVGSSPTVGDHLLLLFCFATCCSLNLKLHSSQNSYCTDQP